MRSVWKLGAGETPSGQEHRSALSNEAQASADQGRRQVVGAGGLMAAGWLAPLRVRAAPASGEPIRFGQTVALTGPLAELGQAMHAGAKVGVATVNARGGVHGRPLTLVTLDDAYDTAKSQANVRQLLGEEGCLGLFGCMGTPMIEAMLPQLKGSDVACFAPLTGALSTRPKDVRNVLPVRASYPEEVERLVQHLATLGLRRIALVTQENAFGQEVAQAADAALSRHGLGVAARAGVKSDASNAAQAAGQIIEASPEAVLLGLAGKPTVGFVKAFRAVRRGTPLYALSVLGSAATLSALGDDAAGIAVAQVVPLPTSANIKVCREFMQAWQAAGSTLAPSHLALEGYIDALVLAEVLRRCPATVTRASFLQTAWSLRSFDVGGFEVGFDAPGKGASRFVDLTLIGRDGRFIH
ncbi:ABC transporter substrate-binding protein [Ideonella sp. DXS29W]|uniref:ABC transporter substrate-binding protein n=1 Tax=Ideonella lacteola TaxID=2984193 RepID=A0ABU9BQG6_9BURK